MADAHLSTSKEWNPESRLSDPGIRTGFPVHTSEHASEQQTALASELDGETSLTTSFVSDSEVLVHTLYSRTLTSLKLR